MIEYQSGGSEMLMDYFSYAELSRITGKSRPTLYKYIHDCEIGYYDGIPYTFLQLLKYAENKALTKNEIIDFCQKQFSIRTDNTLIREIVLLLQKNAEKIDLEKLKFEIEKEIQKNG